MCYIVILLHLKILDILYPLAPYFYDEFSLLFFFPPTRNRELYRHALFVASSFLSDQVRMST